MALQGFSEIAGKRSAHGVKVPVDDLQVIARRCGDLEFLRQAGPNRRRIVRELCYGLRSDKFDASGIKMWPIIPQSKVRSISHPVHDRREPGIERQSILF